MGSPGGGVKISSEFLPGKKVKKVSSKKRFSQGHGYHLQTEPELSERLSREREDSLFSSRITFFRHFGPEN